MTPSTQSRIPAAEYSACSFTPKLLIRHSAPSYCVTFFFQFANVAETGRPKQLSRNRSAAFVKRLGTRVAWCRDYLGELTPLLPPRLFTRQSAIVKRVCS